MDPVAARGRAGQQAVVGQAIQEPVGLRQRVPARAAAEYGVGGRAGERPGSGKGPWRGPGPLGQVECRGQARRLGAAVEPARGGVASRRSGRPATHDGAAGTAAGPAARWPGAGIRASSATRPTAGRPAGRSGRAALDQQRGAAPGGRTSRGAGTRPGRQAAAGDQDQAAAGAGQQRGDLVARGRVVQHHGRVRVPASRSR